MLDVCADCDVESDADPYAEPDASATDNRVADAQTNSVSDACTDADSDADAAWSDGVADSRVNALAHACANAAPDAGTDACADSQAAGCVPLRLDSGNLLPGLHSCGWVPLLRHSVHGLGDDLFGHDQREQHSAVPDAFADAVPDSISNADA
jgi:hypothetical protein